MTTALLLRTCDAEGHAHGGFRWPLEVGAVVEAPDWAPTAQCGNGLHGLSWGEGDASLLSTSATAIGMVVEAELGLLVDLGGKVKAPRVTVRFVGTLRAAATWLAARAPGRRVHYGTASAGDRGTASAGDRGVISVIWYNGAEYRRHLGAIGQDGLLPDTPYRVDVIDGVPRWIGVPEETP